jgi:curli biogenesis system outer membrane secretion channel CsgG
MPKIGPNTISVVLGMLLLTSVDAPAQTAGTGASVAAVQPAARTLKRKIAIARFTNETNYGRSFLLDKDSDPIGKQAVDILSKKLLDTGKFILLERADIEKINAELGLGKLEGLHNMADYLVVGSITAFGRKTEGNVGVFTRSKKQTAYAKVTIRLLDVRTGEVIYADEGSGEAFTEVQTAVGLGPTADYDSTLNDKVLDAAITNLASNVIGHLLQEPWKAYIIAYSDGSYVLTGGQSQGVKVGDTFDVLIEGSKVHNPATDMDVTLPGHKVAQIQVSSFAGEGMNEVSIASVTSGDLPKETEGNKWTQYAVQEPR